MTAPLTRDLQVLLEAPRLDLAAAALVIARLEFPRLDPRASLAALDAMGERARGVVGASSSPQARIERLNALIFDEEGFAGNRAHYDDFRNSLLNVVLDRRLGIPITLALVYMEVAARAGVDARGVSFPGHFLLSVPGASTPLILDPFAGGRALDEGDCRALLARISGEDAGFDPSLLRPCSPRQLLARMLTNLKRTYVELQSFPQARQVCDLLLTVEPLLIEELRDRGLIAYQLGDHTAALRDLDAYLRLTARLEVAADERDELIEHVATLRRRLATRN